MPKDIEKRIKELREEIKRHNRLYYTEGKPQISDLKYDALIGELKKLEKEHPEYKSAGSPTQKVGAPVRGSGFAKVKHSAPMLSLESIHKVEECVRFDRNCKKDLGADRMVYMAEPKLDGLSVELVYENGEFVRGVTRGDGVYGEDVTENIKTIKTVPRRLKGEKVPVRFAVRGEVLMYIKDFQELNKKQAETGKDLFANPRNAAAGALRQLDAEITAGRTLDVFCYEILDSSEKIPPTQEEVITFIKKSGLKTAPDSKCCSSIEEAVKYHDDLAKKRDDLDFEIDGVVIKINDLDLQRKLGWRTTNPRWAVAFKFEPRKEITRVDNIAVQVGRTGVLTPVALLQPVEVGGVTVSRASLHNMDEVGRLGVKIGDYVKVQRAGDVIPDIIGVITAKRNGSEKEFHMPRNCPSCGTAVEKEDVFYRCPAGLTCPAQLKEAISHYASKGAVDIDGFSDGTVQQLYEEGLINSISDVYTLKGADLLKLEGWKEKKTENLLKAIEASKDVTLDRFIFGLGIRNVGKHIALLLAEKFGSLDKLMSAAEEDLLVIKEIGPETASCVITFFKDKRNTREIEKLIERGVNIRKKAVTGKLAGKKIVFTGSLEKMTRSEAKKLVEAEGGEAQSGVSDSTDLVVAGAEAGSKLESARKKGIKVISEKEFLELLK